jgi:hypothetical protein
MSDNVNVNSDVIIPAEFVPKNIIAEKELPPVTSADYEKILQVDDQGNWVAVPDRFHVGDEYTITGNSIHILPIQNVANRMFQIIIMLPKDLGSDVKWVVFKAGSKCRITDLQGNVLLAAKSSIADNITIINSYSNFVGHSLQFFCQLNSGDFSNYTSDDVLLLMSNGMTVQFLAEKPT